MNMISIPFQLSRWTDGWLAYSLYGIVVLAIIVFVIFKVRRARKKRIQRRNERVRNTEEEKLK